MFHSWNVPRAVTYRKLNRLPDDWGTAVNVQTMVFGNMGDDCATGVAFTRDPATGEKVFFGEFLVNAQGEDVVAGIRTPQPINIAQKRDDSLRSLEEEMPEIYKELEQTYLQLENHYKEMQDLEFTIENKKLYLLQTRTGKRTAADIKSSKIPAGVLTSAVIFIYNLFSGNAFGWNARPWTIFWLLSNARPSAWLSWPPATPTRHWTSCRMP